MKKFIMAMVLVITIVFSASAFAGEPNVYHVVLFDLKDNVTPEQVEEMITVWGGSQKERHYVVNLKATDGQTTVTTTSTLTVKRQDCVARDGRFCALANGTVLDTKTGLMWAAKDNGSDINWRDAKRYCENYQGGGYRDWRMPTQDELAGIYDKSKKNRHGYPVTKLIDISACCPWASETRGSQAAYFYFEGGGRYWTHQSYYNGRALPVRSGN